MNFTTQLTKNILFKGLNVLLAFTTTVLMTRLLGAEGNGFFSLLVANTAIITLVISFSLNSGLIYYAAKKEFPPIALFNTVLIILAIQLLVILLADRLFYAIFGFSFYVDSNSPALYAWGYIFTAALLLNGYLNAIFNGNKWFDALNKLTAIGNAVFVMVFGYLLLQKNTFSFQHTLLTVKIFILLTVFQALLNLTVLLKKINFYFTFNWLRREDCKRILTYAGVAFFCNFFQFLAYRMDYWFINYFNSKNELGLYALASRLSQVLWVVPVTIAGFIIPFTVTVATESVHKVNVILKILFNGYIILGVVLAALSPLFIPLIFGTAFNGTIRPFIILLPGVIIFSFTTVLASYFAGINRLDINLKISFFCFLVILAGDILLVPQFGKEGAAIASCTGYAFSGFYSLAVFAKHSGRGFKELLLIKKEDTRRAKSLFRKNNSG